MKTLLVIMPILLLLVSACSSESDRAYAEAQKCAAAITNGGDCSGNQTTVARGPKETPSPQPSPKLDEPKRSLIEESRVYLDSTESMKGFASSQNSTFAKLIESISYAMPGCRLFKYGMTGKRRVSAGGKDEDFAREIRFSQELRNPSFYDLAYNEDDALFNRLAGEDRAIRSVLITDGVYSTRQSELESEVVKAIDNWLKKGRFFGILVFTSPFKGQLYSENKRTWLDGVNVNSRPFYAFVFSPDEKGFRDLREKLSSEFPNLQSLVFPREAVFCPLNPKVKQGLEHKDVPPNSKFFLHMYNKSIFGGKDSTELSYDLRCLPVADYPVAEFNVDVTLDSYSWQQESFKRISSSPQTNLTFSVETGISEPTNPGSVSQDKQASSAPTASPTNATAREPGLKVTFQKDVGSNFSFYHVILRFSNRTLRPTIRALSTEDDSQVGEAEKTYRFYEFVSALTTAHLQNEVTVKLPPPVFVALTNK